MICAADAVSAAAAAAAYIQAGVLPPLLPLECSILWRCCPPIFVGQSAAGVSQTGEALAGSVR